MSDSIVTDLWVGLYGVRFTACQVIFPFSKTPTPALAPTQPPVQWVTLAVLPGVKRRGREAYHSHLVPMLRVGVSSCTVRQSPTFPHGLDSDSFAITFV